MQFALTVHIIHGCALVHAVWCMQFALVQTHCHFVVIKQTLVTLLTMDYIYAMEYAIYSSMCCYIVHAVLQVTMIIIAATCTQWWLLLALSLIMYSVITWKMKTDNLVSILQSGTNSRPENQPGNKDTNVKKSSELKNKKKWSRSTTCLNNNTNMEKGVTKSTSCSALNLPLPSEPNTNKKRDNNSASIYDDDFQASIMLRENTAYQSRDPNELANVSVSAMVNKMTGDCHEYEQLDTVKKQLSKF